MDKFVNYYYITDEDYEEAQKNGINKNRLQARVLRLGWSIKRAKTQPIMKKKNITDEQLKIAKENGVDRRGILSRMSQSGMTLEEAISRPKKQGMPRKFPDWVYEEAQKNGIHYCTVNQRVNMGWSLEKACTEPANKKYSRKSKHE